MYLMVQNQGEIPLWGIRLLGLSRKTEDKIGKFGTGLKEAIALLIRKNLKPIIFTGLVKIDFDVHNFDGVDEICFRPDHDFKRFKANEWHTLNISPELGKEDWDNLYQALREIFCNARDEQNLMHQITDQVVGTEGITKVFVPASPEITEAYGQIHSKLLFLGDRAPQYKNDIGNIYSKLEPSPSLIYHKGVFIQQSPEQSLFDYDLNDIKLNESRSTDWYYVYQQTARLFAKSDIDIINRLLLFTQTDKWAGSFEQKVMLNQFGYEMYKAKPMDWQKAFGNIFTGRAVACPKEHLFIDRLIRKGYRPILFDAKFVELLVYLKVPNYLDILKDNESLAVQSKMVRTETFNKVWRKFKLRGFTKDKPKPKVFIFSEEASKGGEIRFGFYKDQGIYINKDILGSREERITIIEELVHYITGSTDASVDFQNYLIDKLDIVMFGLK